MHNNCYQVNSTLHQQQGRICTHPWYTEQQQRLFLLARLGQHSSTMNAQKKSCTSNIAVNCILPWEALKSLDRHLHLNIHAMITTAKTQERYKYIKQIKIYQNRKMLNPPKKWPIYETKKKNNNNHHQVFSHQVGLVTWIKQCYSVLS